MLARTCLWFPDDDDHEPEGFGPGECHFVHKRIGRALRRVVAPAIGLLPIPGAGVISSLVASRSRPAPVGQIPAAAIRALQTADATTLKFTMPGCQPPAALNPRTGQCEVPRGGTIGRVQRALPGGFSGFVERPDLITGHRDEFGEAVMGRFGVALEPAVTSRVRLSCPPGMVLGRDSLCYDHLRKSDRKWPPGRRPLLTGGQLNAISIATSAAKSLKTQRKRLGKLGLKC